jgi:AGCS family alanine or glycine:cation symporter
METIERLLTQISDFVWGPPLLILLVGTHLFLTFRLGIQRYLFRAIKMSFERKRKGDGDVSHFAALTALSAFGIGNAVQANSISTLVKETLHVSPWITGAALSILTGTAILGGVKSIARWCALLVPFMAVFYVFGCTVILLMNATAMPETVGLILESAFSGHAAVGGFLGAGVREAIRYGVARGLFSNESGLGSAPIVAAAAQTRNPVRQALVSCTGTFWDTVVVCAMTGLVVVNSGEWAKGLNGASLTKASRMVSWRSPISSRCSS